MEYLCRLFPKASRLLITACAGAFVYVPFLYVCSMPNYNKIYHEVGTYLGLFSSLFVPFVHFLIAKAKKRGGKAVSHGS